MNASPKRRAPWLLAAALLAPLAAGCLPNATWLPDSSGFVYTGGPKKDQLLLFDVAKGQSRVLVDKGAGPAWPAVSPDGKRVAIVLRHDDGKTITLEVAVFDRDGKEQHRKTFDWQPHGMFGPDKVAPQAFWVPGQDKLLLDSDNEAGYYDLKNQSTLKQSIHLGTFGASPIRPDGKGFLAYKDEGGYYFIDWEGKEKKIEPKTEGVFAKGDDSVAGGTRGAMLAWPMLHSSHWDGDIAVVSWGDLRVMIDAAKLTGALETVKPDLSEDKKIIRDQFRLSGGAVVRAVELIPRYTKDPRGPGEPGFGRYRLEVVKPGAKEAKTLMEEADYFTISPAPDGKAALVRGAKSMEAMFEAKPGDDLLFLIDAKGEVAAKIDTAK